MWLLVALILFGIFLLLPFFGLFLTILLLFLPIMLFTSRPTVRVYTKTFPPRSTTQTKNRLEIIDAEYTEHSSLEK